MSKQFVEGAAEKRTQRQKLCLHSYPTPPPNPSHPHYPNSVTWGPGRLGSGPSEDNWAPPRPPTSTWHNLVDRRIENKRLPQVPPDIQQKGPRKARKISAKRSGTSFGAGPGAQQ